MKIYPGPISKMSRLKVAEKYTLNPFDYMNYFIYCLFLYVIKAVKGQTKFTKAAINWSTIDINPIIKFKRTKKVKIGFHNIWEANYAQHIDSLDRVLVTL